jgi:hypothetical protein
VTPVAECAGCERAGVMQLGFHAFEHPADEAG